jgi:hypothetical protein
VRKKTLSLSLSLWRGCRVLVMSMHVVCIVTTGLRRVKLGKVERCLRRTETRDSLIGNESDKAQGASENVHSSVLKTPEW